MSDGFTILAIRAESGHGKDFCGRWFVEKRNFVDIAFADHIKRLCNFVLEFGYVALWGDAEFRNQPAQVDWDRAEHRLTWFLDDWLFQLKSLSIEEKADYKKVVENWLAALRIRDLRSLEPSTITPRLAIQLLGTEFGRDFKKTIWSSLLLDHQIPEIRNGRNYKRHIGTISTTPNSEPLSGVIITDCRYMSELLAIQEAGGYVIKIVRNSKIGTPNEALKAGIKDHSSELELQEIPDEVFDLVLAIDEGADNVFPRLAKMLDTREFEQRRKNKNG